MCVFTLLVPMKHSVVFVFVFCFFCFALVSLFILLELGKLPVCGIVIRGQGVRT